MKTTIKNTIKSIVITALLFLSSTTFAGTFFMCAGATLKLTPAVPAVGTHYVLDIRKGGTSIAGYPLTTVPATVNQVLATDGSYEVIFTTVLDDPSNTTICVPDPTSDAVNVLPALTMALNSPSATAYCATSAVPSSEVTQVTGNFPAIYAADLETEYRYEVIKGVAAAVNGTTYGTVDQATGKYTLTTTTDDVYKITGYVKYKLKATSTATFLGTTGCEVNSSATQQTVTVTLKPAKPTITFALN